MSPGLVILRVSIRVRGLHLVLFTGWDFATEGKKATNFAEICCALGVAFNLARSFEGVLEIQNTESRVADLVQQLAEVIAGRTQQNRRSQAEGQIRVCRWLPARTFGRTGSQASHRPRLWVIDDGRR